MTALLVLPPAALGLDEVRRAVRALGYRLGPSASVVYWTPPSHAEYYRALLAGDVATCIANRKELSFRPDLVAYLHTDDGACAPALSFAPAVRAYTIKRGQLTVQGGARDNLDDPWRHTHLFNRLSGGDDGFYFFPYGYLFRCLGLGPINAFGHRIQADLDALARRPAEHLVVAIFGGSAAWSIYAQFEEMFCQRLQERLSRHLASAHPGTRVDVVNLAQNGNVVMNELITFLMFCDKLRPNIVIAHDGFNDLAYGQSTDAFLLRHGLTYPTNIEHWGAILHGTSEVPVIDLRAPCPVVNNPPAIIGAYGRRLVEFQTLAQSFGAVFVSGLQPMIYSKSRPSPAEEAHMAPYLDAAAHHAPMYKNMPLLYEKYLRAQPRLGIMHFVDFHSYFARFGAETTLFGDIVHTLPPGDDVIAAAYCDFVVAAVLPKITSAPRRMTT